MVVRGEHKPIEGYFFFLKIVKHITRNSPDCLTKTIFLRLFINLYFWIFKTLTECDFTSEKG